MKTQAPRGECVFLHIATMRTGQWWKPVIRQGDGISDGHEWGREAHEGSWAQLSHLCVHTPFLQARAGHSKCDVSGEQAGEGQG